MNIGILAHVDAGKTTLTESILLRGGAISSAGRVDDGTTVTDSMELERQRGITIRSASVSLFWEGVKINLLDTPGHVDFIAEVERALQVLDGAVLVLSAREGVQVQTRVLFRALARLKIPTILYLNKLDRTGADLEAVYARIQELLTPCAFPLQHPTGVGSASVTLEQGVPFDDAFQSFLLDSDAVLGEKYLSELPLTAEDYEAALGRCVRECKAYPILHGVALKGLGTEELLTSIVQLFPGTESVPQKGTSSEDSPLAAQVFQIYRDAKLGRLACLKVTSGQLALRDSLLLPDDGSAVKVRHLYCPEQGRIVPTDIVPAGDIAFLAGMPELRIGMTLGGGKALPSVSLGVPTLETAVTAENLQDRSRLIDALEELTDEDPFLASTVDPISGEISIRLFGEVQLEILSALISERYGIAVRFGTLTTLYMERPAGTAEGRIPIYTSPNPYYAMVALRISPLPPGTGLQYETGVSFGYLTVSFQNAVQEGVEKACLHGLWGFPVTDAKILLFDAHFCSVNSSPSDFRKLTPYVFEQALQRAGTVLMEPILHYQLRVPAGCGGKAAFDLREMRGTIDKMESCGEELIFTGQIPAQTCTRYPAQLSAYTNGLGIFLTQSGGYGDYPGEPVRRPFSRMEEENRVRNLFINAGWLEQG